MGKSVSHEQAQRSAWKGRETEVAIEGRRLSIQSIDHDGENRQRTGGPEHPANRVGEQKIADSFAAKPLVARKPPDEGSRNGVIARETLGMFARQVGDGEREGTQAVESD